MDALTQTTTRRAAASGGRPSASDAHRIGEAFERHHARVATYVWRRTGDRAATEDLVAETFALALERLAQFRGDVPMHHWLLGIAANLVSRRTRRRTLEGDALARRASTETNDGESHARTIDARDELDATRRAIDSLPEGQQAALTLHCLEGLEITRIAAILDVAEGTVKSRIFRARESLRGRLAR